MSVPFRIATTTCLVLVVIAVATVPAQRSASSAASGTQGDVSARITASAQALLTKLDNAGRAKVQFPFEGPQKTRWSNLPSPMFERQGLRMGDLTTAQRAAVMELLAVARSRDGYRKVSEIMQGDEVLRKQSSQGPRGGGVDPNAGRAGAGGRGGGRGGPAFGEDQYYLAFLGT